MSDNLDVKHLHTYKPCVAFKRSKTIKDILMRRFQPFVNVNFMFKVFALSYIPISGSFTCSQNNTTFKLRLNSIKLD